MGRSWIDRLPNPAVGNNQIRPADPKTVDPKENDPDSRNIQLSLPRRGSAHPLAEPARQAFLAEARNAVLSPDDLDALWDAICARAALLPDGESRRISFRNFNAMATTLPQKFAAFIKPSFFLHFPRDEHGRIDALQFFNFVLRMVSLMQARIDLSTYDKDNDGYLLESDLQTYIRELIPSLNLRGVSQTFEKFYICTAVRKFLFFFDPLRKGKVAIENILLSPILTELFELRDPDLPRDFEQTNWFSGHSALRVYGQFLNLDVDKNGMISRKEISKYRNNSYNDVFLDRIFQEFQTYDGQMDYNAYLDFVLAMENMQTPESIAYCFKLLDIHGRGYIDEGIINVFFREIVAKMIQNGQDPVSTQDVINEIFDMANPSELHHITLKDLIKCGVGGTIINILCDYRGFHNYESRESQEK